MVSVAWLNEFGPIEVERWTKPMMKRAKKAARDVLEGVGILRTDVPDRSGVTRCIAMRRECTDDERRLVLEQYLESAR